MFTAAGYQVLIRGFPLALSVEGLQPRTIANYVRDTERFAAAHAGQDPQSVTPADIRAYVLDLQTRCAPKTVCEFQLGPRRFSRFLLREGEIVDDPTANMKLTRYRVDPQPTYTHAEVKRLLLACNMRSQAGLRDRALVMVLYDTGVRDGELVSMGLPDWDARQAMVVGKTGVRRVPLGTSALQAVEAYVRRWGINEGLLWRGKKGPLTGSGVLQLVRCLCARAGVEDKGVHAFRRAAAAQMKRLGMQDSDIVEVMGWKNITMLRRYIAAVAGELAHEAHDRYSPGDAIGLR